MGARSPLRNHTTEVPQCCGVDKTGTRGKSPGVQMSTLNQQESAVAECSGTGTGGERAIGGITPTVCMQDACSEEKTPQDITRGVQEGCSVQ